MSLFRVGHRAARTNAFAAVIDALSRDNDDLVQRAVVESNNVNEVYVIRGAQTARDDRSYPKATGLTVSPGDEVILLRVRTGYIVLCGVTRN